ncbi:unnamed protein product, partial [Prorocentrum cordatum]
MQGWASDRVGILRQAVVLHCAQAASSTQPRNKGGGQFRGLPGNDLRAVKDVLSAELSRACSLDTDCVAWVWGEKRGEVFSDMCFLKGGHPRGQITRVPNPDVVSGQPTQ